VVFNILEKETIVITVLTQLLINHQLKQLSAKCFGF